MTSICGTFMKEDGKKIPLIVFLVPKSDFLLRREGLVLGISTGRNYT